MPVVNKDKDFIVKELIKNDIEVRPLIAGNMASKPMWLNNFSQPSLPNSELLDKFGFYIPNHQDLTFGDLDKIIKILNAY